MVIQQTQSSISNDSNSWVVILSGLQPVFDGAACPFFFFGDLLKNNNCDQSVSSAPSIGPPLCAWLCAVEWLPGLCPLCWKEIDRPLTTRFRSHFFAKFFSRCEAPWIPRVNSGELYINLPEIKLWRPFGSCLVCFFPVNQTFWCLFLHTWKDEKSGTFFLFWPGNSTWDSLTRSWPGVQQTPPEERQQRRQ